MFDELRHPAPPPIPTLTNSNPASAYNLYVNGFAIFPPISHKSSPYIAFAFLARSNITLI